MKHHTEQNVIRIDTGESIPTLGGMVAKAYTVRECPTAHLQFQAELYMARGTVNDAAAKLGNNLNQNTAHLSEMTRERIAELDALIAGLKEG